MRNPFSPHEGKRWAAWERLQTLRLTEGVDSDRIQRIVEELVTNSILPFGSRSY